MKTIGLIGDMSWESSAVLSQSKKRGQDKLFNFFEGLMIMPCVHEFGIIEYFDRRKNYGVYAPEEYNCVPIEDDLINDLSKSLKNMRTYFHTYNRPEYGLAYWGVTIIPPESLSLFYDVVVSSVHFKKSDELKSLATKINEAREEKKYMIHFGV